VEQRQKEFLNPVPSPGTDRYSPAARALEIRHGLRRTSLEDGGNRGNRLPGVWSLRVKVQAAIAKHSQAEFAGFRVVRTERRSAIGARFRSQPPAGIAISILDAAINRRHRGASSSYFSKNYSGLGETWVENLGDSRDVYQFLRVSNWGKSRLSPDFRGPTIPAQIAFG